MCCNSSRPLELTKVYSHIFLKYNFWIFLELNYFFCKKVIIRIEVYLISTASIFFPGTPNFALMIPSGHWLNPKVTYKIEATRTYSAIAGHVFKLKSFRMIQNYQKLDLKCDSPNVFIIVMNHTLMEIRICTRIFHQIQYKTISVFWKDPNFRDP